LWGKLYQLKAVEIRSRTISATNGFGETGTFEKGALRPLCRNRGFYPFRVDNADAWVIFPDDVQDGEAREIGWPKIKARFPRTAAYLKDNKKRLLTAVETESGNRWHLYKYSKNLVEQPRPKVLFPMTIEDTLASVDAEGDVY
jgi:hypothetical protein